MHIYQKHFIFITLLLVVVALVAMLFIGGGIIAKSPNGTDDRASALPLGLNARLTGHGESDIIDAQVTIAAVLNANKNVAGGLSGQTITRKNFKANVVELVPPSLDKNYWCVNGLVRDVENIEGYNWIWFVKDNSDQTDEISLVDGFGISCGDYSYPPDMWVPLSKGDFKGEVRN